MESSFSDHEEMRFTASPIEEDEGRRRVVEVARTWIGTKYHHMGMVKGVGVDCATLLMMVYAEAALIPRLKLPYYSAQWHLHRGEERYLGLVTQYAVEIPGPPLPGDVVLWKFGRCFSHGAIVTEWPFVVHAYLNGHCTLEDISTALWLRDRPMKFFSYWGSANVVADRRDPVIE